MKRVQLPQAWLVTDAGSMSVSADIVLEAPFQLAAVFPGLQPERLGVRVTLQETNAVVGHKLVAGGMDGGCGARVDIMDTTASGSLHVLWLGPDGGILETTATLKARPQPDAGHPATPKNKKHGGKKKRRKR
jgi:hypothetical protein